jgi:hypothetical protein
VLTNRQAVTPVYHAFTEVCTTKATMLFFSLTLLVDQSGSMPDKYVIQG